MGSALDGGYFCLKFLLANTLIRVSGYDNEVGM